MESKKVIQKNLLIHGIQKSDTKELIHGIQKSDTKELTYKTERVTAVENKLMVTKGEGKEG